MRTINWVGVAYATAIVAVLLLIVVPPMLARARAARARCPRVVAVLTLLVAFVAGAGTNLVMVPPSVWSPLQLLAVAVQLLVTAGLLLVLRSPAVAETDEKGRGPSYRRGYADGQLAERARAER